MKQKFSIYTYLKERPLSYSAFSSFHYNPEQWYETYILGKRQESPELTFGSMIDKKIQDDPTFLPALPRYEKMQYKMSAMIGKNIPIVGVPDGLNLTKSKDLCDFKTGRVKWDKKRADETDQLTWYLLLVYINLKLKPDDFKCFIHWLPTERKETGDFNVTISLIDNNVKTFETKRSMVDILKLIGRISSTIKEMEKFVNEHE